ncbi:MAG: hypothetical protein A3F84_05130 [Candidatus Handelsmanbacteria bacterium RIFCSPLOWO2_12_FULL_64_10]|uniref:Uncharacterized protein n=1 Tax=Handelsmanbacteria sp. (strain RIFCSPLOWO2_12_FULL_64_10) TaxID=1817868 RepID=A0A1F6CWL4_HANXR|nr:MAG: hypothetical protein A3F84_05130 [Candidatus Handelsmanbacteria bacterium RIFCSPLOWO2_12_FULL_64_10]
MPHSGFWILTPVFLLWVLIGCSAGPHLTTKPVKWTDPDNKTIPKPKEIEENQAWDILDHTLFYEVGKPLDLGWTARRAGNLLNLAPVKQADNVNALDEVPNSSWYTNRHFLHPMTPEELARGPGLALPDTGGPWEITEDKSEGGTAGFWIRDATGTRFILKFDSKGNDEMASSSEVIATKILHAAGYNVPKNSVVTFHPSILRIGPKVKVTGPGGVRRPMTEADLQDILSRITVQPGGRLRCVASEFLKGVPVGVFDYHGRRRDDPNDRVDHEHRRELRGLRVIASWMNDADRRAANTLNFYVTDERGRSYIKHYLIDMGSCFGSNNLMPHPPKYGNEYVWDPRTVGLSLFALGLYKKAWEDPLPMKHPSLGYFENETFRPGRWVPTYPNPAFERCTNRDGYWGAKIVMSFSDEDVAAMVRTGHLSDPGAEAELTRLLIERRDMIGRHWFGRINPLDRFSADERGIRFEDLAVRGRLASASETTYRYRLLNAQGKVAGPERTLRGETCIPMTGLPPKQFYGYEVRTLRAGQTAWSRYTRVYFYTSEPGRYQIVRVEREE